MKEQLFLEQPQRGNTHEVQVTPHKRSGIRVSPQNAVRFTSPTRSVGINAVLADFEVEAVEQLLPEFRMPEQARSAKSYGGKDVVERDLGQLHLITLRAESAANTYDLIERLKELDEVEFAEPNYVCYALGTPMGEQGLRINFQGLRLHGVLKCVA